MNDRAEDRKQETQETNKTPEKAGRESSIADNSKQDTWGLANKQAHKNDVHPSEVNGIKAIDSFGINFDDGSVLTAKGFDSPDKTKEVIEVSAKEGLPPAVSTKRMMDIAKAEHDHPTRWRPPPAKCNMYLDKVTGDAGMRVPWKHGNPPTSADMNKALSKSKDFEQVWKTDYSDEATSLQNFQYFEMQPGDLAIWDVPLREDGTGNISHSAIATGSRRIIYAGSAKAKNGCGHCDVTGYTGTPDEPLDYGPPTAIYRYKNMSK